jgi:glycosyltransferase involved in cell wall biosynthesis
MNPPMPLLTIAVPTFNRSRYLEELLPQLVTQIEREPQYLVELLVIDNASTDGTRDLIASKFAGSLRYLRNPENIGGDRNFLECIKAAQGKYVWLFGDDEVINPGGVRRVIEALAQDPDLVIAESSSAATKSYDSYKALLQHVRDQDPVFPVHHTLITKNIFPKSKFDLALAQDTVQTNYGHMYGLVESLKSARKIIVLSAQDSAFHVRDVRAEFADPPTKLEDKLIRLNCHIAEALEYRRLRTDIWLYYKARPLYKLRHSKKVRKLLRLFA